MYTVKQLNSENVTAYERLAYPRTREYFRRLGELKKIKAVGAELVGKPIGLIWGEGLAEEDIFIVSSIYVLPKYRNMGVGAALLESFEPIVREGGWKKLKLGYVYQNGMEKFERTLCHYDWYHHDRIIIRHVIEMDLFSKLNWLSKARLPEPFTIFQWNTLSKYELRELKSSEGNGYPRNRSPFRKEQLTDSEVSMGLRYHGDIIGWSIFLKINEETFLVGCIYTKEEFQFPGRAIPVLAESIKAAYEHHYKYGVFDVNVNNKRMLHFVKRRLAPVVTATFENRWMWKDL